MALEEITKGMSNAAEVINSNFKNVGIVASGTNVNGEYIKFGDGTLICYSLKRTLAYSSAYTLNNDWTFPIPFVDNKIFLMFNLGLMVSGARPSVAVMNQANVISSKVGNLSIIGKSETWGSNDKIDSFALAIGKWK